jgi:phosphatidylglycerophosphate synthase
MANALTAVRLLLVFPFAFLMAREDMSSAGFAALVIVAAIATDLLDGPIARRTGTASAPSRTLDHTADFLFVTSGLTAGVTRAAFPWILPLLVTVAFAQYVIDSYWFDQQSGLRMSRLGRYNGILYFVPLCCDVLIRMGLTFLQPLLNPVVWMLVVSTLLSMGQRLMASGGLFEEFSSRLPEEDQTDPRVKEDEKIVLDESESGHLTRPFREEYDPQKDRD